MARSSPNTRSAARLSALLGTPVGRPYPASGRPVEDIPTPRTPAVQAARTTRHAPLPQVLRPAIPSGRTPAVEDPPTLPLALPAGWTAGSREEEVGPRASGNPHFAALLAEVGPTGDGDGDRVDDGVEDMADGPADDPVGPSDEYPEEAEGSRRPGSRPGRLTRVAARWVPAAWRGSRLDPGRAGALALVLVAAVAAVVAAVGVWSARPRAEQVPPLPAVSLNTAVEPSATSAAPPTSAPVELVVSVSGKVRRPGLVRVPDGSRVADVLDAAGGALPGTDLAGLNLARRVADGEQVAVGVPAAADGGGAPAGPAPAGGDTGGAAPAGKVDLNRATVEQLDALPGVGPVTAQRILDWRTRNGRFARVDQLREVEGIGERRFTQLRELVTV
ncbi:helix-hairpin-helix domain-containing protein [Pseudonocardia sp. RS11V-5]|uniref:ComEA family DNA-binding protein n=1 Tax=Pseudonocardia terrae TaxID=2905831 RepID=UPI001E576C93|nr:ComEA family DNA-binding protein [Pseudonocardia terrae]MCE3552230.1 helix-hairpin-helix domain-containing protein [Pseudonocardia terrae]